MGIPGGKSNAEYNISVPLDDTGFFDLIENALRFT